MKRKSDNWATHVTTNLCTLPPDPVDPGRAGEFSFSDLVVRVPPKFQCGVHALYDSDRSLLKFAWLAISGLYGQRESIFSSTKGYERCMKCFIESVTMPTVETRRTQHKVSLQNNSR